MLVCLFTLTCDGCFLLVRRLKAHRPRQRPRHRLLAPGPESLKEDRRNPMRHKKQLMARKVRLQVLLARQWRATHPK